MASNRRRALLAARYDGKAEGLEVAAKAILAIVDVSTRVVGTNTLRELASALRDAASDAKDRSTDLSSDRLKV